MKLRRQVSLLRGPIDVTPLIDVVLLLLIFFLLSRTFVLQPGMKVEVPRSLQGGGGVQAGSSLMLTITMEPERRDSTGAVQKPMPIYFFNDQIMTLSQLETALNKMGGNRQKSTLILKADQSVPHGAVVTLLNLALTHGFSVVIATEPEEGSR